MRIISKRGQVELNKGDTGLTTAEASNTLDVRVLQEISHHLFVLGLDAKILGQLYRVITS